MKRITRQQAELLYQQAEVVNSSVEQKAGLLCVHLTFADDNRCIILYDNLKKEKTYYHHAGQIGGGGRSV